METARRTGVTDSRSALSALLAPRGIAVVGVSSRRENFARRIFDNARLSPGMPVVAVNPEHDEPTLLGAPCYPSITGIVEAIDLAIVASRPEFVPEALEACRLAGVPIAQVVSAGLGGWRDWQHGPRIVGPNSYGSLRVAGGLTAFGSAALRDRLPLPGGVAVVSHSGAVAGAVVDLCTHRGVGLSAVVTTGDEADLTAMDVIEHLAGDDETKVVCWYAEGVGGRTELDRAIAALHTRDKRLVVLASGRSAEGRRAVMSHTGHAAPDSRVLSAYLRAVGVPEADGIHELVSIGAALSRHRARPAAKLTVLTTTGGIVALTLDQLATHGLAPAPLDARVAEQLAPLLTELVTPANPIDLGAAVLRSGPGCVGEAAAIASGADPAGVFLFVTSAVPWAVDAIEAFGRGLAPGAAGMVLWLTGGSFVPPDPGSLEQLGVPICFSARDVAAAVAALTGEAVVVESTVGGMAPVSTMPDRMLDESGLKAELDARGVAVPVGVRVASSGGFASETAHHLRLPVVVKAITDDVLSRGAAGLVTVGLATWDAVDRAVADLVDTARHLGIVLESVLIEEQVTNRAEVFVGLRRDATFGAVLAVGIGGAMLAVADIAAVRPLPVDSRSIHAMLTESRVPALLQATALPLEAAIPSMIASIEAIIGVFDDLGCEVFEVNPLVVTPEGRVVAVDAHAAWA